jgi:hypothetical protein
MSLAAAGLDEAFGPGQITINPEHADKILAGSGHRPRKFWRWLGT